MFTGIIQSAGEIAHSTLRNGDLQLVIRAPELDFSDISVGDSIAVNGVCLTATKVKTDEFCAHVSAATLAVTAGFAQDQTVNLEKAMRLSDRLGGHLVSGHVDCVGTVRELQQHGEDWHLAIQTTHEISQFIAQKGSICVNGVSLTVNQIKQDIFSVNLIPHTWIKTNLNQLKIGSRVNIEIDQIARYVARMAEWAQEK